MLFLTKMDNQIFNTCKDIHDVQNESYKSNSKRSLESLKILMNKYTYKKDLSYYLEKLCHLITDRLTQNNKLRIDRILKQNLSNIRTPFEIKHIPAIIKILEFLASKIGDVPEYKDYLDTIIKVCGKPPLLEKSSDHLWYSNVLVNYFTGLGCLMVSLKNNQRIINILESINRLLIKSESHQISTIKIESLQTAVEKSQLPLILTDFVQSCSAEILKNILDTTFVVASISDACCHRMLERGIFNHLIQRFANLTLTPKLDENLLKSQVYDEIIILTNNLWMMLKSISPPQILPDQLKNLPAPDNNAMRSLRDIFHCSIQNSKSSKKFLMMRNDLAGIILGGIVALPFWRLVNCGIAEDVITAAVNALKCDEMKSHNIDDFIFNKTLLSILCYFSESGGLIAIMKENYIIPRIFDHLEYTTPDTKIREKSQHFLHLMPYKLRTLVILVPKMADEFIINRGSRKLSKLLSSCMKTKPMNLENTMEVVRAISCIISSQSIKLLEDFRKSDMVSTVYQCIEESEILEKFSISHQRILTLLLISIEYLIGNHFELIEVYQNQTIETLLKIIDKLENTRKNRLITDEKLLIAVASFIGECIIPNPEISERFITNGSIYNIIDIAENTNLLVQNVYFRILIDFCTYSECIPYICTWRGNDKRKGFMSLLAHSWRKEEIKYNVKRTPEGCIEDVESPLMQQAQWDKRLYSRTSFEFSPSIASMIGSIRPKIYSIRKILLTNSELCKESKECFHLMFEDLSVKDTITFCIIDQYLRFIQGQVWMEVFNYLQQIGVNPVGTDGEMLLVMSQRYYRCAIYVQDHQKKIIQDAKRKELIEEHREFTRIHNLNFSSALMAIKQIDFIRRTIDGEYRKKKEREKNLQLNKELCFPSNANSVVMLSDV